MSPKVSIVIPVYNDEAYLSQCLDSVLAQTLKEIEIICVDDHSTDNSGDILKKYEKERGVICIFHDERMSASQSRKDAVLLSKGDYIMFVDADDYIEPNACEIAYKAINQYGTDILQFNTIVENCSNLPAIRIENNQRAINPRRYELLSEDLLYECFVEHKFGFQLWNKIYNGEICRRAFGFVTDGFFPKANDLYGAFFLLRESKSICFIRESLYHYCFGRGMTGHSEMSIGDFKKCCDSSKVYFEIERTVEDYSGIDEKNTRVLPEIRKVFLNEQSAKLISNVDPADQKEAIEIMKNTWADTEIDQIISIVDAFWYKRDFFSRYLKENHIINITEYKRVKNIALYYRSIRNGGAQRVVAQMCNLLSNIQCNGEYRFNVVLVTSEQPSDDEYELDSKVSRFVIPDLASSVGDYKDRAYALWQLVDKYDIDIFINSMWVEASNLWDFLCLKSHRKCPGYFIHAHNFCAVPWKFQNSPVYEMSYLYSMVDGVITLSKLDQIYWSLYNSNTYLIPNPCNDISERRETLSSGVKYILWVGRISKEKQPLDMLKILKYVTSKYTDVCCHILGEGDEELLSEMKSYAKDNSLEDFVVFEGFHLDVGEYYRKADVVMFTSLYEGYPLTFFEAASFGVPTVSYDLPWLLYYDLIDGWERVPQGDIRAAGDCIIDLLSDADIWEDRSRRIHESYDKCKKVDIFSCWEKVFDDYERNQVADFTFKKEEYDLLIKELVAFHGMGYADLIESKNEVNRVLNRTYDEKSEINAKLQKTYKEKFERGLIIKEQKAEIKAQKSEIKRQKSKISKQGIEIDSQRDKILKLENELELAKKRSESILRSRSYKLGKALAFPVRLFRKAKK